jgi:hypothetical protein
MGNHLSGCFGLKARAGAPDTVSLREGERDDNKHIIIRTKRLSEDLKFYTWRQCTLSCCNCALVCAREWVRRLCNTASLDVISLWLPWLAERVKDATKWQVWSYILPIRFERARDEWGAAWCAYPRKFSIDRPIKWRQRDAEGLPSKCSPLTNSSSDFFLGWSRDLRYRRYCNMLLQTY